MPFEMVSYHSHYCKWQHILAIMYYHIWLFQGLLSKSIIYSWFKVCIMLHTCTVLRNVCYCLAS